jgi:hypothetical protein
MMQSATGINSAIECCGIVCDDARLEEIEDGSVAVSIPWQNVKRITLRDGILAPHPILQIVFGLAFASLAYFPVRHLIDWLQHGGTLFTLELWVIAFASIGVWFTLTAFRRGLFFEVETVQGTKRLVFQKHPEPALLDNFVKSIEKRFGTRVEKR